MTPNNVVVLTGRIAAKQLQLSNASIPVLRFPLAVDRPVAKAKKNDPNVKTVDFFQMVAFNNEANLLVQYARPGSWIQIVGRASTEEWVDQATQQKRTRTEFIVESFHFLNTGGNGQAGQNGQQTQTQQHQAAQPQQQPAQQQFTDFYPLDDDDDLPF